MTHSGHGALAQIFNCCRISGGLAAIAPFRRDLFNLHSEEL